MAAELQPPDNQITTGAVAAAATTATASTVAAANTAILPALTEPPAGPLLAMKRQRRPSVRLGEIGEQPSYDSHMRRTKPYPRTWRLPKDQSSKSIKARSITNLVNGGDSYDYQETDDKNQNGGDDNSNLEFTYRKVKSKRATTKRARTNWVSRFEEGAEGDSREDGDETFREFDPDSDSQLKDQSPVHSVDNLAQDFWPGHRRTGSGRTRVSDSRENEFDNNLGSERGGGGGGGGGGGEEVRTWLIELGLSRYAPVFEIHEVDDEVLPMLTLEDLKDMGINAVGSRRKLYTAIQKLRKGFS